MTLGKIKISHAAVAVAVLRSVFPEYPIEDRYWLLMTKVGKIPGKQYYKPFGSETILVIKPQWEPYEEKDGDIVLELILAGLLNRQPSHHRWCL